MASGEIIQVRAEKFEDRGCEPMLLFWYVNVGDDVHEGQDLCEVETAKAVFVVTAPARGRMVEICVAETDPVESEQLLARIETT